MEESETLAEAQLRAARHDPRLDRGPEAMVADWRDGVAAIERTRGFLIYSVEELHRSLAAHVDKPLDSSPDAEVLWQRRELADAEIANGFAEFNAMSLVALLGALDSLVEALVPSAREMRITVEVGQRLTQLQSDQPELFERVEDEVLQAMQDALVRTVVEKLGSVGQARGGGAQRWEEVLRHAGLQAPEDRPIPDDLNLALNEIVAIRNVLVHNGSRVDEQARQHAPTIPFAVGELIRIDRNHYRHYSAAVLTFGDEVTWRLLRGVGLDPPDLKRWRQNYSLGG
jgi:hypothetical protein